MKKTRALAVGAVLALALGTAACGDDDGGGGSSTPDAVTTPDAGADTTAGG